MKYLDKKKRVFPWIVALIPVVALAIFAMILFQAKQPVRQEVKNTVAPVSYATQAPQSATEQVVETTEEEEYPPIEIETPFCTLYYPGQWAEGLRTEITGEEFDTAVRFYGTVAGEEQLLFVYHFGGAEGLPVGTYETADGILMDISLEMVDLELSSKWTQEEMDYICAMQEAMNYVLSHMGRDDNFTPIL